MLTITFQGLGNEFNSDLHSNNDSTWIQWRHLILFDLGTGQNVAEWFYVAACSKEYSLKNDLSEVEKVAMLVQDTYDEDALLEFAREKFDAMSFRDWDDFYTQMSKSFVYEDEDDKNDKGQ